MSARYELKGYQPDAEYESGNGAAAFTARGQYDSAEDVFGNEEGAQIQYRTMSWQLVSALMIAEIVSNGMLSLPSSLAVVGMVPGVIIILFLGIFATFTSWLLIEFKLCHPQVHSMGDAGMLLFGPIGRDILAAGTIIFAIFGTGSQLIAGQTALASLSDSKLCSMLYTGIFTIPVLICSLPRTLDRLSWLSILAVISILFAGIVGMIGAGINPTDGRVIDIAKGNATFIAAFGSVTNPVFAYAGHFMFFILISEMKDPRGAMKAAYTLQGFSTSFYIVFAVVTYYYLGSGVASPSFSSLPPVWAKAAYGIAIPNFLIAGSLYSHTAAKLVFVRLFRRSRHLHSHTVLGWAVWVALVLLATAAAFVLAIGVPIFNYLIGIAASLFASWYTYGIAGFFWLFDAYHFGMGKAEFRRSWVMTTLCVLTILAGAFICVAGMYVTVDGIVMAYQDGTLAAPFSC
ncbi:unnamed protein product [Discula destructiva]